MKSVRTLIALGLTLIFLSSASYAASAPDSTSRGPHEVAAAEYHLPAVIDNDVLPEIMTEVWGKMYYPSDIQKQTSPLPLIMMLHGNHPRCGHGSNPRIDSSCEYTETGVCPEGSIIVPNHEGYAYLAENLASWGYIVVSINANRGITCGGGGDDDWGLNLARGRLILKHLAQLYQWSTAGNAPTSLGLGLDGLIGKIDFAETGFFGHSRGGEGVRAAYNLYQDKGSQWPARIPGLRVKAIYEIGAVDGQTSRVLDANGTVWHQLLPMCDGDVSDLEGRFPFERMLLSMSEPLNAQKSIFEVWGANHNFFNTEWQESDTADCAYGKPIFDPEMTISKDQQTIALASVAAFFRSHLGKQPESRYNQNFNPLAQLPAIIKQITQVDRDFTTSPGTAEMTLVEDFDQDTGVNSSKHRNLSNQIQIKHVFISDNRKQRAAEIIWSKASDKTYFEAVLANVNEGRDFHRDTTLDFRIARTSDSDALLATDFSVRLESDNGTLSDPVSVSRYATVNGPGTIADAVFETIRIPLSAFKNIDLSKIHGVRFVFNKSEKGHIYLANIRIFRSIGLGGVDGVSTGTISDSTPSRLKDHSRIKSNPIYVPEDLNSIKLIGHAGKTSFHHEKDGVEIRVKSHVPFPAMNRLPILKIGTQTFMLSRYVDMKELKEMSFFLTDTQYRQLESNSEVTLKNGKIWKFGRLSK